MAGRADTIAPLAELFREYGYEGASLALIQERTGLGKGSLYNFYPGGKPEMAEAVLGEIDTWFETHIYRPLRTTHEPRHGIRDMMHNVLEYFHSGRRVCLVGAFALDHVRDRFAARIRDYFAGWVDALTHALQLLGHDHAQELAREAVATIQGALVLARALDDPQIFVEAMRRLEARLLTI